MGYKKETIKGISWVGLFRLLTRIIALGRTAILARIFNPLQFGLFGIASLVLALIEILTDTGINVFLVQTEGNAKKYLNTAWIVSIIRGILIGIVIFLTSFLTVGFFENKNALGLVMLISIVPVIRGFINPSVAFFQKELQFNKEFYYKSLVFLIDTVISVMFAIITKNIYSLVIGLIFSAVFEVVFSFIYASPRPRFKFNHKQLSLIVHKGKWITLAGIFNYAFSNLDTIIVGKMLGTYSLGLYQMAYKTSVNPLMELSDVISRVTFPVYVRIAKENQRVKKAFLKSLTVIGFIAVPVGFIAFGFADLIINILLGEQWKDAIPIFRILIIFGIIRTISGYASALFLGFNKQKYVTIVTFISLVGMGVFIYPLIVKLGITGAAYSALIGALFAVPVVAIFLKKIL